jgi:hypothetical protein
MKLNIDHHHPTESFMAKYQSMHQHAKETQVPTKEAKHTISRIFLHSPQTPDHLEKGDLVLIVVPEEMQIHGLVDPQLHCRVGWIVGSGEDDGEVKVELKRSKRRHRDLELFLCIGSTRKDHNAKDLVSVPKFCLCLEERILNDRIAKRSMDMKRRHKKSQEAKGTKPAKRYIADVNTQ